MLDLWKENLNNGEAIFLCKLRNLTAMLWYFRRGTEVVVLCLNRFGNHYHPLDQNHKQSIFLAIETLQTHYNKRSNKNMQKTVVRNFRSEIESSLQIF